VTGRLSGCRALVVGASSGIGRSIASVLSREGADVAIAARRISQLENLATELDGKAVPVELDVRDEASCSRGVAAALDRLGGLDALVYAVGIAPLVALRDADAERWRDAFETNVVGAALVTRAVVDALTTSRGRAVYLSSISASEHPPRSGIALYVATKSALEKLVDLWQVEHHSIGFTRVSVGDTGATEMAASWDPAAIGDQVGRWVSEGRMFGRVMEPEAIGRHVADLLAGSESVPVSSITPRYAPD
jgi:NAD(P)-dependent dehydrogenase (short-subunit alcohol dehydrogenase family)